MTGPTVKKVMSEGVKTISADSTVKKAAEKMRKNGIRGLVAEEDGEIVGIVAGKDILYKVVAEGEDPSEVNVDDIMTEDVIICYEYEDISEAAHKMIRNDISRIPVITSGGNMLGMITQTNILHTWPGYVELLEEKASSGYSNL